MKWGLLFAESPARHCVEPFIELPRCSSTPAPRGGTNGAGSSISSPPVLRRRKEPFIHRFVYSSNARRATMKCFHDRSRFKRRLMMAAAVSLLLFTAVDLLFPAACSEERNSYGTTQTVSIVASGLESASLQTAAGPGQNQASAHDCFCCCSHLMAGRPFVLAVVASVIGNPEGAADSSPSPTIQIAYKPPRLS